MLLLRSFQKTTLGYRTLHLNHELQKLSKVDLRSDTVSLPTLEMRLAMANAIVGDDVYKEDPTINKLEAEAAAIFGKEAGLFVSSGSQGNLLAIMTHCQRGDSAIIGDISHTNLYERGGMAALAGVMPKILPVQADGTLLPEDILKGIDNGENDHYSPTKLVILENTQNTAGGMALSANYTNQIATLAHQHNLKLHLDGARIFNAATDLGVDMTTLTSGADSLTFCLSKGLCAPVGSVLLGSRQFILEAKHWRKMLGGGMRQGGVLAAAGLVALHVMSKRLREDHERATFLALALSQIEEITQVVNNTNFVWFKLSSKANMTSDQFHQQLRENNILVGIYPGEKFRCVFHYWITQEMVEKTIHVVKEIFHKNKVS